MAIRFKEKTKKNVDKEDLIIAIGVEGVNSLARSFFSSLFNLVVFFFSFITRSFYRCFSFFFFSSLVSLSTSIFFFVSILSTTIS